MPGDPAAEASVLPRAAAVESASEHPIGRAIVGAAAERGIDVPAVDAFRSVAGSGVLGSVEGVEVALGTASFLAGLGLAVPRELAETVGRLAAEGRTVVLVGWGRSARGLVAVSDQLKPSAGPAVADLRAQGIEVVVLTGDNRQTGERGGRCPGCCRAAAPGEGRGGAPAPERAEP